MLARSLRGILYFLVVVIIVSCSPFPNSSNTNTPLLNAPTSLGTNAPTFVTGPLYVQPVDSSGILYLSSWLDPDGSDFDKYVWDSFTLQSNETITEIDWYGGYDPLSFGKGGAVVDFTVAIYSSTAGNTEPAVANPPLVEYQTGGNAGETSIGQVNGTPMYAYAFPLPADFAVSAGVKYWVQIEAWQQGSSPDWGLASASGGNGSHYLRESGAGGDIRYRFATGDAAFTLLGPVPATPTDIFLDNTTVDENQPIDTVIGGLTAASPDPNATFTFNLTCAVAGADDGFFNISGTNLRTSAVFDYETKSVYTICIRVTDQGGLTFDQNFVVTVNDLNEAPTDLYLSSTTVDENQPVNTVVGVLSATDPDTGATFTFSLACTVAGVDDGSLNILGTNLRTSAMFDFETKSSYNICIRVTDQGGLSFDKNFVVTVNNLVENTAPTDIILSNTSVDENQPVNTVVGTLSATDPDAGASFTFGLACAVPGADDGSFNILGTNLRTSAIFDYETKFTYNICVRVTDQGGLTFDKNFSVTINNLSENTAPTDISLSNTTVDENQPINTLVGALTATDPDAGATFTFSLACTAAGADDGSFNILGTNLRTSAVFDYETKTTYNLCIRVTDQGGLSYDKNFVVNVNNLNEAPTGVSLSTTVVDENRPVNTIVGGLSAADPDSGSAFTFSLACAVVGADDGSFNILGTNLRTSAMSDFETKSSYNICIRVTDQGGLSFDKKLVITVNDVIEITNTPGKVTGGGNIDLPNKKATFGFVIRYDAGDINPSGNLTFIDHSEKLSLKAASFTLLYIDGNHARITGFATVNDISNVSFTLDVYDYGEPGTADVFMLQIPDMNDYSTGDVITGGNIKVTAP